MLYAHSMYGGGEAKEFTLSTNASWIKYVDGFPVSDVTLLKSMGTRILGRINLAQYEPEPISLYLTTNPDAHADYVFTNKLGPGIDRNPGIEYWETTNEPVLGSWKEYGDRTLLHMRWLNKFTIRMCELIAAKGKYPVIGNFSVGTPDLPEHDRLAIWREFLPAMRKAADLKGYLGLHEYIHDDPKYDTWLQYRYTHILSLVKSIYLPILITEFGSDYIDNQKPWRKYYSDISGYISAIKKYIDRVSLDKDIVKGVFLFTFGSDWPEHNVDEVGFTAKWLQVAGTSPTPTPTPTPTPSPVLPPVVNPGFEEPDARGWNLKVYKTSVTNKNPIFRIERAEYGASRLSRYRGNAGAQIFGEWICWEASLFQVLPNFPAGDYRISAYARCWARADEVFDKETDNPEVECGWGFIINGQKQASLFRNRAWDIGQHSFKHSGGDLTIELFGDLGGENNRYPFNKTAIMFDDVSIVKLDTIPVPPNPVNRRVETTYHLRLRSGPGTNFPILSTLYAGTILPVMQETNGWYRVTFNGWVSKAFTREL